MKRCPKCRRGWQSHARGGSQEDCTGSLAADLTPESVNLTDAATILVTMLDDPELGESHKLSAMMVWTALTGASRADAEAFARHLTRDPHPLRTVRAYFPTL